MGFYKDCCCFLLFTNDTNSFLCVTTLHLPGIFLLFGLVWVFFFLNATDTREKTPGWSRCDCGDLGKNINNHWPCLPPLPRPIHVRVNPQHKDLSGLLENLERGNMVHYQSKFALTRRVSPKPSVTARCSISCSGGFLLATSSASASRDNSNYAAQTARPKALSHWLCQWQMRNLNPQLRMASGKCPSSALSPPGELVLLCVRSCAGVCSR